MKHLRDLLGNDHPLFSRNIAEMEQASGNSGIDTKLVGEIMEKAHAVLRSLGVDPADSTAKEVYEVLKSAVSSGRAEQLLGDTAYVLLRFDDGPVSFNIQDVIENAHHELPFNEQKVDHAQRHLRMEVIKRYAGHERTHEPHIRKLAREVNVERAQDSDYAPIEVHNNDRPRMLAVGDIFTDAFIKLDEDYAKVEKDADGNEWLKLPFGAKPPYETVDIIRSVGPSPNAVVACSRLGLDVGLMAWVGGDDVGKEAIGHLKSEHVDTGMVAVEEDKKTSYWYVLRHGSDRTMLVKSEDYTYEWHDPAEQPDWVYLAYIGQDSWALHENMLTYLEANPEIKFVFQPATYHFEWGTEKLAGLYRRAYMVVMNREEAEQVTKQPHDDIKALADGLHALGPAVVVITDGAHGSYASHGGKLYTIPNYPDPKPPLDRTGAGDAFASTITAALALGKSIDEALRWAPVNSASVVQELGAQRGLLTLPQLEEWLSKAPETYKVSEV